MQLSSQPEQPPTYSGLKVSSVLGGGSSATGRIDMGTGNLGNEVLSNLRNSTNSESTDVENFWKYLDDNKIGAFGTIADRRSLQTLIKASSSQQGKVNYQRFSEVWLSRVQQVVKNHNFAIEKELQGKSSFIRDANSLTFADKHSENTSVLMVSIRDFEFDSLQDKYSLVLDGQDHIGPFNSVSFEGCNQLNTFFLPHDSQKNPTWEMKVQILNAEKREIYMKKVTLTSNSSVLQVKGTDGDYLFQIHFTKERANNLQLVVEGLCNTKYRELTTYKQDCIKKLFELIGPFPSLISQQIASVVIWRHPDASVRDFWEKKTTGGRSDLGMDSKTARIYQVLEEKVETIKNSLQFNFLLGVSYLLLLAIGVDVCYPIKTNSQVLGDLNSRPPLRAANFPDVNFG